MRLIKLWIAHWHTNLACLKWPYQMASQKCWKLSRTFFSSLQGTRKQRKRERVLFETFSGCKAVIQKCLVKSGKATVENSLESVPGLDNARCLQADPLLQSVLQARSPYPRVQRLQVCKKVTHILRTETVESHWNTCLVFDIRISNENSEHSRQVLWSGCKRKLKE